MTWNHEPTCLPLAKRVFKILFLLFQFEACIVYAFLEPGKWTFNVTQKNCHFIHVHKALYAGSKVTVRINCDPTVKDKNLNVRIGWVVRQSPCFEEYLEPETMMSSLKVYYDCPFKTIGDFGYQEVLYLKRQEATLHCNHLIDASLRGVDTQFQRHTFTANESRCIEPNPVYCDISPPPPVLYSSTLEQSDITSLNQPIGRLDKRSLEVDEGTAIPHQRIMLTPGGHKTPGHQIVVPSDGIYILIIKVIGDPGRYFNAQVDIEMKTPYGYLSAVEYPLLIFYGIMCIVYVSFAIGWTIVSALQWKDLLRIQFWIGAVIFIGMIEKAVFYAEHQSVNSTGRSVGGAVLFAELLSCLKRTLARMLVIIVSLGFGIVKPRLGAMFHRVVTVGFLYFVLSATECVLRVYHPKNDPTNQAMMAGVPLAALDSVICWWIFGSLVQTTRTLRLRRNLVKLSLYTQFTNTLVGAVLASIFFMIWQIHTHRLTSCLRDWNRLWLDEAFWHILFSVVLLVIMILWRPTNNNQRYAFTQLLDGDDDEDELIISSKDILGKS